MKHPKPLDVICVEPHPYVCCTAETLKAYGLIVSTSTNIVLGYRPDPASRNGISWNEWDKDADFAKVIQAQCNRTYRHGDKFQGQTLLSATFLADQLRGVDSELVYFKDNAFSEFKYADPQVNDTIVTREELAWTVCTLQHLQKVYGLALTRTAQAGDVFGYCPITLAGNQPVTWTAWSLLNNLHDENSIDRVVPTYSNRVLYRDGSFASIGATNQRLWHRETLLKTLSASDAALLVSFKDGVLHEHCDLKLA